MNMKFYLKISSILVAAAFLSTLPVEAQTFRQTKQGITGTTQGMDIEIQFVSPEIVRVVKAQVDDLNQRNHKHFMRQRALYASVPII